jgi:hypothetical protein
MLFTASAARDRQSKFASSRHQLNAVESQSGRREYGMESQNTALAAPGKSVDPAAFFSRALSGLVVIHISRNKADFPSQPFGGDKLISSHFPAPYADDDIAVLDHRLRGRRELSCE